MTSKSVRQVLQEDLDGAAESIADVPASEATIFLLSEEADIDSIVAEVQSAGYTVTCDAEDSEGHRIYIARPRIDGDDKAQLVTDGGRIVEDIHSEWPDADGAWRVRDADDETELVTDGGRDYLAEWHALTGFKRDILRVLAEEERYGLAIKRQLEDWMGVEVNHGRLYPNLDDLVNKDLVEKSELDKRTNEYALTADGRRLVAAAAQRDADLDLEDVDEGLDAEPERAPAVADGGLAAAPVSVDDFENDPVEMKIHPHYVGVSATPSYTFADYSVRVHVDIEPIDAASGTEEDWATLAYEPEDIVELLVNDSSIVEDREELNARFTVTAEVLDSA